MKEIEIINKEIEEGIANISHQHNQIRFYFQTYLIALIGIFTISGYFAKDGLSVEETIVGAAFVFTVFFLGWVFLSIISHKIAMLILLYKHIAIFRSARLKHISNSTLKSDYVLPHMKSSIVMPSMLKRLPYLVFVFNYLVLVGGLAFYFAPHMTYHQTLAVVGAVAVTLGAFYPVVCITFNKHFRCSMRAKSIENKHHLERAWAKISKRQGLLSSFPKYLLLCVLVTGSISIAILSFYTTQPWHNFLLACSVWIGVVVFGAIRWFVELYKFRFALRKVKES